MSFLIQTKNIGIRFGGLKAVDDFSLAIPKGGLYGLIGPNGAGKTTAFNLLTGVYQPNQGSILFDGQNIVGLPNFKIAQLGIGRTFQNIRLFKNLTVLENVLVAFHFHSRTGILQTSFLSQTSIKEEAEMRKKALELLSIFHLENKINEKASSLPYGDQRKLEIVRALATAPKLLMLDEPAAGMNHAETHQLMKTIHSIQTQFDLTILLIEHDMKLVMGICEQILVLDRGLTIAFGSPKEIQNHPKVIEAYLGVDSEVQP